LPGGVPFGRQNLTKGVFEYFDSGQKTVPGPLQATGLDDARRGIEPKAHPRLTVEKPLQPADLQRPISEPGARQH
jgi:hypothetical protein